MFFGEPISRCFLVSAGRGGTIVEHQPLKVRSWLSKGLLSGALLGPDSTVQKFLEETTLDPPVATSF